MISKEMAAGYCLKFGQMRNFPRDMPAAFGELVLAMECADTEEIARRATATFLDNADPDTPCPMPRNIREAIYAIQEPIYAPAKPEMPHCPACLDTGIAGGFVGGPRGTWCDCLKAQKFKADHPGELDAVNELYDKLTARLGKKETTRELLSRIASERRTLANVTDILSAIDGARRSTRARKATTGEQSPERAR